MIIMKPAIELLEQERLQEIFLLKKKYLNVLWNKIILMGVFERPDEQEFS